MASYQVGLSALIPTAHADVLVYREANALTKQTSKGATLTTTTESPLLAIPSSSSYDYPSSWADQSFPLRAEFALGTKTNQGMTGYFDHEGSALIQSQDILYDLLCQSLAVSRQPRYTAW